MANAKYTTPKVAASTAAMPATSLGGEQINEMATPAIWLYQEGVGWVAVAQPTTSPQPAASISVSGIARLATTTETQTGTDATIAVTPAGLQSKAASTTASGIVELADNTETQTGTDTVRAITPAGLQSKAASATASGIVELATNAETLAGTDTTRAITPANLASLLATGSFSAGIAVDQNNIVDSTFVKVNYASEEWDVSGWYDTSLSRYTPLRAGIYHLSGSASITPAVATQRVQLALYKNGVEWARIGSVHTSNTGTATVAGGAYAQANGTTDYFEIFLFHNFGVGTSDITAAVNVSSHFQGVYHGPAS